MVHFLAHAAMLFRDLLKVLVETRLERNESRQWGEIWLCNKQFNTSYNTKYIRVSNVLILTSVRHSLFTDRPLGNTVKLAVSSNPSFRLFSL